MRGEQQMILIKKGRIKPKKIYTLDISLVNKFLKKNKFTYRVNLEEEIIEIEFSDDIRCNDYGDYCSIFYGSLNQIIGHHSLHMYEKTKIKFKKNNISLSFLDEIHFVGTLFIDRINSISKERMYAISLNTNNRIISDEIIKKEYDDTRRLESNNPLINKQDNIDDDWWMNPNSDGATQTFKARKTFIELLGLFVKEEHAIYICENNISRTITELSSHDPWFSENINIFTELVVLHEIGHSVFQYNGFSTEPIKNETRANYYSSFITNGLYDDKIYHLTTFQPFIYRFPYLSFGYMHNLHFERSEYRIELDDYFRMVGVLYEGL